MGASVTGGYVCRGSDMPGVVRRYLFGDFVSGRLFAYKPDPAPNSAREELAATVRADLPRVRWTFAYGRR